MLKRVRKFTRRWYERFQTRFQGKGLLVVSNPAESREENANGTNQNGDVTAGSKNAKDDWTRTFRIGFVSSAGPALTFHSLSIQGRKTMTEADIIDDTPETDWRLVAETTIGERDFVTIVRYRNMIFTSLRSKVKPWTLAGFKTVSPLTRDAVRTLLLCLRRVCNLDNHIITDHLLPYLNDYDQLEGSGDLKIQVVELPTYSEIMPLKLVLTENGTNPNLRTSVHETCLMFRAHPLALDCHFELMPSPTFFSIQLKQELVWDK